MKQVQFSTESRGNYVPVGPFDAEAHDLLRWLRRPQIGPVQPLEPLPNTVTHEENAPRPLPIRSQSTRRLRPAITASLRKLSELMV